ncbi:DNA mismatch repair protein MLH1 [Beauveria bassiana]|uniref:DNA mismatch repair protein MLH1 n=1 Tax=Beauveria bassiana TaxID=176275 RepID=A0A2N6NUD7_BEABA|nr:DNA mismatch repair protein MLH1 [Beauveria bassiana]
MDVDAVAGTKRKADADNDEPAPPPRRIRALDIDVVNKIAAGEIIVAPVHALKELLENAIDAGSTALEVLVKDGGLKLLQITDNGSGIQKDDLVILCERHTTSKIAAFEDLAAISTYGFRGEALASISHIAHLTVTTKTKDSALAWRAHYLDGKLVPSKPGQPAEPKGVAGRPGTQIAVEDLFFSIPTRRKAFRSYADEFNKILDMVGRYAIHSAGVAFTCKKAGESSASLSIPAAASTIDRVRQIYGGGVANELVEVSASDERWGYKASALVTNANYHIKKTALVLFINHRAVESTNIKKAIEQVYSAFLPKGGHPFVYLSLDIDPARVDVNVHPTKKEVHFLNEDEILHDICNKITEALTAVDTSRTFKTQTLIPGAARLVKYPAKDGEGPVDTVLASGKRVRRNSNDLVRTDTSERKITSMFTRTESGEASGSGSGSGGGRRAEEPAAVPEPVEYDTVDREYVSCSLGSIKQLRAEVRADMHRELTDIFSTHTFVGIVDEQRRLAAIQGGVKLFLVDYGHTCFEYFYQLGLTDFGNMGAIRFSPPLDLTELLTLAATEEKALLLGANNNDDDDDDDNGFDAPAIVARVRDTLVEKRQMLLEYFSLEISPAAELVSLPLLVKGYTPPLGKLPRFLLRLGPHVDWSGERACFQTFLRELATFYSQLRLRLLVHRLGHGACLGDGFLEMLDEVVCPKHASVVRVLFLAVNVKELVERLDGLGGGSLRQRGDDGDEKRAELAVNVRRARVHGELANDADALDAEALKRVLVRCQRLLGAAVAVAAAPGGLVEGDELALLAGLQRRVAAQRASNGPGETSHLRGEAEIGRVGGENRGDDLRPDGFRGWRPGGEDAGVVAVGKVYDGERPGNVVESGEGMALHSHGHFV